MPQRKPTPASRLPKHKPRWRQANSGSTSSGAPVWKPKVPVKSGVEEKLISREEIEKIECKVCSKPRSATPKAVELEPPPLPKGQQKKFDRTKFWYSPWLKAPPGHYQISMDRPYSPPPEKKIWQTAAAARVPKKETLSSRRLPNYLFFLFSFPPGSFIGYQLYAAKLPESPTSGAQLTMKAQQVEEVVSFPSDCFPYCMCCVQLDSKLYFFGGNRFRPDVHVEWNEHPRQLYILEPSITVDKSGSICGGGTLKKGSPMNTGKPAPYAMVAKGKIYIVSPIQRQSYRTREKIDRFEVFDPDRNIWEVLPEPPNLGLVYGHALVGDKILISVLSGKVFYYEIEQRYWGRVSPDIPFMGIGHYVNDIFYNYAAPECELMAFTSSGTDDTCGCDFELNPPRFDPGFDCQSEAELEPRYTKCTRVIQHANELIHLGDHTFCCAKVYTDPVEDYRVKIASFHASHTIENDFLVDIFHVSDISVPIIGGNRPEFLCFVDACSVPFVHEEECENEALLKSKADIHYKTLWEISVEHSYGKVDDDVKASINSSHDDDDGDDDVEAWIKRGADISKQYGVSTTPWGITRALKTCGQR